MKPFHFVFIVILLSISSACDKPSRSNPFKEIRISLPTEPPTLDWNLATDNVAYQILNQLMEGLTQYDENLKPIPAVAESWEVLDKGKTYIFHLNKNYLWSDGVPVTAEDFQYSWLRLLNPETASEYAYFLFDIEGAREFNADQLKDESRVGITVINPHTLKVTLNKPVVFFPSITTFMVTYPLRKDIIDKHGDGWTTPENMVTCGPYILKEWWHEYRLELKINPHYGGSPKPDITGIKIFIVGDPQTVLSLYEQGYLDMAPLPPIAVPKYRNNPNLITMPKLRGYYYGFNIKKKPFDEPLVRRALALSLNKEDLPKILKGGEKPVDSWIPPGMFGYNDAVGLHFNPEEGRKILQQAGYNSEHPFPLIELAFNSDPVNKKIAEWAQAQWKKNLGIDVSLRNEEWKSYLSLLKTAPPPLFRLGWGADFPDPDNFMNLFTSYSGNNHTGWNNTEYDALILEGAREENAAKRKEIYDKAQEKLLMEGVVIIPLFIPTQNLLVKEHLRPYPLLPLDFVYYKRVEFNMNVTEP